jgi:catechol 2,3-dioxygenase-like lactoylglutathione lyase family enzyme
MEILRAKPIDAARLTEIAHAAKRHWGYPEHWIEIWSNLLTIESEFIVSHETCGAVVDNETIGFYALGREGEKLDLLHLWVLPRMMRRGVGRALFVHAVERMKLIGCRRIEIESDPHAEGFYRRMGARLVGTRIRDMGQDHRELPVLVYGGGRRLSHVNISMPQGGEDAARSFYTGLLGLTEIPKPEPIRSRGGVWFDAGGLDIHLSIEDPHAGADAQRHFGLEYADVDGLRAKLHAAGIATDSGRPAPWKRFFVHDPFGNRIEIHEPGGLRG